MTEQQRRFRSEKKPPIKGKGDRILNYLITIVVILIIVVAGFIFSGNDEKKVAIDNPDEVVKEQPKEKEVKEEPKKSEEAAEKTTEVERTKTEEDNKNVIENFKKSESVKVTEVNDAIVLESIEDVNWAPLQTKQTTNLGENHASSYDESSLDWGEKIAVISTMTGLPVDNMTVWYIKNNGGITKSIGTVSSKDEIEKYRVSLVWIPNKGWKAEKVEILKEINGAY